MTRKGSILLLMLFCLVAACSNEGSGRPAGTPLMETGPGQNEQPVGSTREAPLTPTQVLEVVTIDDQSAVDPDLSGALYYVGFVDQKQNLLKLDLKTGEQTTIFTPPENAWLSEVALSPDGKQILMAYSPPPEEGQIQFGLTDLYLLPAGGSGEPVPLLQREDPSETFFNVSWPVDDYIYYAHFTPTIDDTGAILYGSQVERLRYLDGPAEVLATAAAWPRVSYDGTLLAFVTEENEFILAGPDGSNPRELLDPEAFSAVDAPLFSPDNSLICFSAVQPDTTSPSSFWEQLLGTKVALAHNVPSDWWCMPVDGGSQPLRLTNLNALALYGDFDPDGEHFAFISSAGVYVMNADGSDLQQLREIPTIGTVDWIP